MAQTNVYTGSNGTLTLAEIDSREGKAAKTVMETWELRTVGRVTGVQVSVHTDLEEFHEIGRRHATSLHPGNIHISGKVERAYVNGALLMLLQGAGSNADNVPEPYVQPTFNLAVTLSDPAVPGTAATLELGGVKFQNWNYSMPEEDFVMENVSFRALTIRVLDKEAPAAGGDAVAKAPKFDDSAPA